MKRYIAADEADDAADIVDQLAGAGLLLYLPVQTQTKLEVIVVNSRGYVRANRPKSVAAFRAPPLHILVCLIVLPVALTHVIAASDPEDLIQRLVL